MKILNDYLQQLKDSFGRFCLSMSGEITIADKEAKDLLHLNDEDKQKIASIMHELRCEFPFVLIEKQENMVECHIKLFAYEEQLCGGTAGLGNNVIVNTIFFMSIIVKGGVS